MMGKQVSPVWVNFVFHAACLVQEEEETEASDSGEPMYIVIEIHSPVNR